MMLQDYSNKRWLNDLQPKKKISLESKILLVAAGLSALSYFTVPQFKEKVNYILNFDKKTITHFKDYAKNNLADFQEITIPRGMSLWNYGKQHGLEGQSLRNWVNTVKMHNLAFQKNLPNPESVGIDEKGNLYPGKKLYLIKP